MGAEDYPSPSPRKLLQQQQQAHQQVSNNRNLQLKMFVLVILTNLLTIYIFSPASPFSFNHTPLDPLPLWDSSNSVTTVLHNELNSTRTQLAASHSLITELHERLNSTNLLVQALLTELAGEPHVPSTNQVVQNKLVAKPEVGNNDEVEMSIGPHKLPLGYSPRVGSDEVQPAVGAGCLRFPEELVKYMTYEVGGECPVDDVFQQKLMLKGCEPLPRRRCHPKSPANYVEPTPLPDSLWATPPDNSIIWDPYTCKSYQCLIDRTNAPGYYDCKDCFNLRMQGREKNRWLLDKGAKGLDYGIDQVLNTKPHGTIRIGLDIGGGTGTFAARMRERNVTIITSTMNLDGPFNSFIASRGLIPIHLSVSHRLPFFENTLDIVHSMHVLSNWIPDAMLEFTLYDIYRVLRPGGLFWLDRFFCLGSQLNKTYVPMLDRIGFNKLRWNAGAKLDRGKNKNEWYFSALLEKPMT